MNSVSTINPMIEQEYYICESPLWTNNAGEPSTITVGEPIEDISYTITGPLTMIDIEQYLSNETAKLIASIKLAKDCDNAAVALNTTTAKTVQEVCNKTFTNFSQQQIQAIKNNILAKTGKYESQLTSANGLTYFAYTDDYIASKVSANDKKGIFQRTNDMINMLTDFSDILNSIDQPEITSQYLDQTQKILAMFQQNNRTRDGLEKKLEEVYGQKLAYNDSKQFLDSTIYISVLWTILATTALFYMFKKM